MTLFGKRKYTVVKVTKKREIPSGLWVKCEGCGEIIYNKQLEENLRVCPKCGYHFVLGAQDRIRSLLDGAVLAEYDANMVSQDPLGFVGVKNYKDKIREDQNITGLKEAAVTGEGAIDGKKAVFGITDSRFIMGSMGSVVGEKISRAFERATKARLPIIVISGPK